MTQPIFALNQGNDGMVQSGSMVIPGCSNAKIKGGSVVTVEIENGKVTLVVFGDINSTTPTHEIDLSGALENRRASSGAVNQTIATALVNVPVINQSIPETPQHIGLFTSRSKKRGE